MSDLESTRQDAQKRILYVLPHPGFFAGSQAVGGHVAHVRGFVGALTRLGVRTDGIGPPGMRDQFRRAGAGCVEIKPLLIPDLHWSFRLLAAIRRLRRQTKFDACYVRYAARFAPFIPLLRPALGKVPLVLEVNSLGSQRHRFMRPIDQRALRVADLVVTISTTMRDYMTTELRSDASRTMVLPNGVDLNRFERAAVKVGQPSGKVKIAYIGVLKERYGLEDLITAFAALRAEGLACELNIVGDGPARDRLRELAARVPDVFFKGPMAFDDVPQFMQASDILVYTNTRTNSFQSPVKLFEYMACGRAIVAADTPIVRELHASCAFGLIYEQENPQDLESKLRTAVLDAPLRSQLAARALNESANHSWESKVRRVLDAVNA